MQFLISLKRILLISLLFLMVHTVNGQILNFRMFRAEEGLIQSQVHTILQDNDGYMWFGTVNGISIYDGREFRSLTVKDGLAANFILSGVKDREGNLWFGHRNGMLTKYNWQTKKLEKIYLSQSVKDSTSTKVKSLFVDDAGRVWAATEGWGAFYFDKDSLYQLNTEKGLASNNVNAIGRDKDGHIWIGTDSLITIYTPHSGKFDTLIIKDENRNIYASSFLYDAKGFMWIGTLSKGLFQYHPDSKKVFHFTEKEGLPDIKINTIFRDRSGKIWLSNEFIGVAYSTRLKSGKIIFKNLTTANGLPFDGNYVVTEDREGNLWFGTSGRGAAQLRDKRFELWVPGKIDEERSVWSIFIDSRGNHWFGTGDGVVVLDKNAQKTKVFKKYKGKRLNDIFQIRQDNKGKIWFTSNLSGLYSINKRNQKIQPFNLPDSLNNYIISSVEFDKNGNSWFGGIALGLYQYNPHTKKYKRMLVPNKDYTKNIMNISFKDSKSVLWFGLVNGGLYKYDGTTFGKVHNAPNSITNIVEGTQSDYWLINDKDQLFRFKDGKFKEFGKEHGLEGNALFSVLADSNSVWVGTSSGLAQCKYGGKTFKFFNKKEGFPFGEANEAAVYKDKEGRLWFGTMDGAVCFHPELETISNISPLVHIRDLKLFLKNIPFPPKAEFSPGQNYLTFDFIGINMSLPEAVRYRYRLLGIDEDWLPETSATSATYPNLSPGTYTFQVKARNGDNIWTPLPTEYTFTILAPFWRTWWFSLILAFVFILLVYLFIYWRTTEVNKMNAVLGKKVEERTSELQKEKEAVELALAALKESETKFRTYTELTSSGIYIHQDDKFQYVNKAGRELSGYSADEILQMNIWDIVHPDYRTLLQKRFADRAAGKNVPDQYEFKYIKKNGEEGWMDFSGLMIDHNNKPALLATVVDITERKTAEEALLSEKERLAVTLRSIGDGVITTNIQGRITLINEQAKNLIGCGDSDPVNDNLEKILFLFDEQTGKKIINPVDISSAIHGQESSYTNCVLKTLSGGQKFISFAGSPLKDKNNQRIGVVFVLRDITEKRQMEQELFKSQKLESVGVLAGGIAHDFNNILTAIIGNLSLAKLNLEPAGKIYNHIEKAEKASARAQELTQQLLTFSKGGAPVKKAASIEEVVKDSVGFVLSGSNVKCRLDFEKNLPPVEIDSGQISQVIQNLVINADQAMPEGGNLDISAQLKELKKERKGLNPGLYLQLDVADKGIGISKEYLDKVFDPFFTTKQSGSGLGLATSYSIIQKHGGLLSLASEIGKGTVFTIFLPVARGVRISRSSQQEDLSSIRGHGRVLVMDDELFVQETAVTMLEGFGFEAVAVNDGAETLDLYKKARKEKNPFSAVVMDLTIPGGMGGKQTILKLLELDPEAVAIVSSGYSSDPVMADFTKYGFRGCLKKPYRLEELICVFKDLGLASSES